MISKSLNEQFDAEFSRENVYLCLKLAFLCSMLNGFVQTKYSIFHLAANFSLWKWTSNTSMLWGYIVLVSILIFSCKLFSSAYVRFVKACNKRLQMVRASLAMPRAYFRKTQRIAGVLLPYAWPKDQPMLKCTFVLCLMLLVGERIVNLYVPHNHKLLMDELAVAGISGIKKRIFTSVMLRFIQGGGLGNLGLFHNLRHFLWLRISQHIFGSASISFLQQLDCFALQDEVTMRSDEMLRIIERGTLSIDSLLCSLLFNVIPTLLDVGFALVYFVHHIDFWCSLLILVTVVVYMFITFSITERRISLRRITNQYETQVKARVLNYFVNYEAIKHFTAESYEIEEYANLLQKYHHADRKSELLLYSLNTLQNLIMTSGCLMGMCYCGWRISRKELSIGDFSLYLTYFIQLYSPLSALGRIYRSIQTSLSDLEKMLEIHTASPFKPAPVPTAALHVTEGRIVFSNLCFSYKEGNRALDNVSFEIEPGEKVAIVGSSGSGKSTLLKLMLKLHDHYSGSITIDGQDIRSLHHTSVRQHIGVVPQDPILFSDTLFYNIRYGRRDASDEEIYNAAKAADIHDTILRLPAGYKSIIGNKGLQLSRGEKQRIAIARILLKNPSIILLDEATASLDSNTETTIQSTLSNICKRKTTLLVAHRLSTISDVDKIIVLAHGKIIEQGKHEDLIKNNGEYSDMWRKQCISAATH